MRTFKFRGKKYVWDIKKSKYYTELKLVGLLLMAPLVFMFYAVMYFIMYSLS